MRHRDKPAYFFVDDVIYCIVGFVSGQEFILVYLLSV